MPSTKGKARERELARAKAERQAARRAASERKRRQITAGVVIGLIAVIVVGGLWLWGVFDSDPKPENPAPATSTSSEPSDAPSDQPSEPSTGESGAA